MDSQAYCLFYRHTKPNSQRVKNTCRQTKLPGAILCSHSWQITDCFKKGNTEQDRNPQWKSNALSEGGFCAEASNVQKIVICLLVPKMHKADSKRDFSNCVSRVHLIARGFWLDQSLANQPSLIGKKSLREQGERGRNNRRRRGQMMRQRDCVRHDQRERLMWGVLLLVLWSRDVGWCGGSWELFWWKTHGVTRPAPTETQKQENRKPLKPSQLGKLRQLPFWLWAPPHSSTLLHILHSTAEASEYYTWWRSARND